jgi:hypothetical protein
MLEYLRYSHSTNKHQMNWYMCPACKKEVVRRKRNFVNASCGCQQGNWKHGHEVGKKATPELKTWRKMRERCLSAACLDYKNYGGRGIQICDAWSDFKIFLLDMGPRPSKKHSIERVDVNGHYEKANCVWATKQEQARNTRVNRKITIDGRTECLAVWLVELCVAKSTFYRHVNKGMSDLEALGVERKHP